MKRINTINYLIYTIIISVFSIYSLANAEAKLNIDEINSGSMNLSFSNNDNHNIIIIIRESKRDSKAPQNGIKYESVSELAKIKANNLTSDSNIVIYSGKESNKKFKISSLKPETKYSLDVYESKSGDFPSKPVQSLTKTTLATEPSNQTKSLAFANIKNDQLVVMITRKGNGSRRMIIGKEGSKPELPLDGIDYKSNNTFGKGDKLGDGSFVVYNEKSGNASMIPVKGLKPGTKYYFMSCEANGSGETINYNTTATDKKNPAAMTTVPEAPVALDPLEIKSQSFTAVWKKVSGAKTYELIAATDSEFKNPLPDYKKVDVGDIDSIILEELPTNTTLYYRIRALGEGGASDYSNTIKVSLK